MNAPGRRLVPLCGASVCLAGFQWRQGCPHRLAASEQSSFRELVTVGLDFFFFNHDLQNLNLQLLIGGFVNYIIYLVGKE